MVIVESSSKNFDKIKPEVYRVAELTLKNLKKEDFFIHIFLVKNSGMNRVNKISRGKTGPTNVLSFNEPINFPHPELHPSKKFLGEVYLAPEYIKKHKENISFLAIHGILHLAGYTHDKVHDKIKMKKKEKEILVKIKATSHARLNHRP